jgi:3-mercaptopyruvate sulfurtransferase SseA
VAKGAAGHALDAAVNRICRVRKLFNKGGSMANRVWKKGRIVLAGMCGLVALTLLAVVGCGTSGYDTPSSAAVTTQTPTALIQADTLKQWIDSGLVNKAGGYDRVVILDSTGNEADGSNKYNTVGHIPGAQLVLGSDAFMDDTRAEGPLSVTGDMVATGATMDALIQKAGIDENTTIVLTSGTTTTFNMTRGYATLRYWGFPKNRIKILQGGNAGWTAAGNALSINVPTVQKSTYAVAPNGTTTVNTEMRASLGEMIAYVKGIIAGNADKVVILDTIRPGTVSSTTDLLVSGNNYTPFDGAIKGSYRFPYANLVAPAGTLNFKDADTIKADISAAVAGDGITAVGDANRDAAKTFVVFCRAGNAASVAYFALDGIAYYNSNVDVKWYDGSLGQWNLMATSDRTAVNSAGATVNAGGKLAVGSIWDTTSLMDNLTWNVSRTVAVPVVPATTPPTTVTVQRVIVPYGSRVFGIEPSFAEGNQIEAADKAYRSVVTGTSGGGAPTGGGGC